MALVEMDFANGSGGNSIIVKQGQFTSKSGTETVTIPEITQIRTLSVDGNSISYALDDNDVEWFK